MAYLDLVPKTSGSISRKKSESRCDLLERILRESLRRPPGRGCQVTTVKSASGGRDRIFFLKKRARECASVRREPPGNAEAEGILPLFTAGKEHQN